MKIAILALMGAVATLVKGEWFNNIPVPGKRPVYTTG